MHKPLESSESDDNVMNADIDYDMGLRGKLHNSDELKYYNQIYQYKKELANRNVKFHISAQDLMDLHHDHSPILHLNIVRRVSDTQLILNGSRDKKLVRSKTVDTAKIKPLTYQMIWLIKDYKIYYHHDDKKYNIFIIEKDAIGKITCVGGDDHKIKTTKLLHKKYKIKTINHVDIIYKSCDFAYPMYISCKDMTIGDFMNNLQPLLILNEQE